MSLFAELKRRNVFRVGIAYAVAAWILLQATDVVGEILELPPWGGKLILLMVAVGFFISLFLAWAFELTPEGVKREKDVDRAQSVTAQTGRKLDFAIIGLLALALAYFIWESRFSDTAPAAALPVATEPDKPAANAAAQEPAATATAEGVKPDEQRAAPSGIVVLPFVNMSADPDQEYFSDGLSEEILNALAQIEDLRVISRTSAFAFKGKDLAIPDIARQLDVSHVLEGSVRTAGDQVRITAQLIEVATDSHLWSDAYNRSLENVFEVQEEISLAIANELQLRLADGGTQVAAPTRSAEAYQLFLRGRHEYQKRGVDDLRQAIDLLEQALEIDPDYADAWANLAASHIVLGYNLDEGYEAHYAEGKRAAQRAVTIDPDHGFGHAVLGLSALGDLDWERAVTQLERAEALNPNESNTLVWQGIVFSSLGYIDRAVAVLERAREIDPVFMVLLNWSAIAHEADGDLAQAEADWRRLEELTVGFGGMDTALIALHRDDLDAAGEIMAQGEEAFFGGSVFTEAVLAALRDPSQRDASVATLRAHRDDASFRGLFTPLYRIGAVEEAVEEFEMLVEAGRGLRAGNSIVAAWASFNRDQIAHPAVARLFEFSGMADYWRAHGDPDFCRVNGQDIECGTP